MLKFGAEKFIENEKQYRSRNYALLINQSSIIYDSLPLLSSMKKLNFNILRVFFPQHGYFQDKQDNMKESESFSKSGIEFVSLYGRKFYPDDSDLEGIDTFVYDLQDVGVRVYTFISTLYLLIKSLSGKGIELFVFDRPNPLSGVKIEGNTVEYDYRSFVGIYSIPMLYGLTPGELALFFKRELKANLEIKVFKLSNWKRDLPYEHTGRFWFPPSPNMPFWTTAYSYGAGVLFEGTNLSEGRGTTRPFELIGAPFIDAEKLSKHLNSMKLPGVKFLPYYFVPQFNKWKGEVCGGVFIKIIDYKEFMPYYTGILILKKIKELYPYEFKWKNPPYEYEYEKMPIDIIAGTDKVRRFVEGEIEEKEIKEIFKEGEENFFSKLDNIIFYF